MVTKKKPAAKRKPARRVKKKAVPKDTRWDVFDGERKIASNIPLDEADRLLNKGKGYTASRVK